MTDSVVAANFVNYVAKRNTKVISGEYKNEHSQLVFQCLRCSFEYQKSVTAFKRSKPCRLCKGRNPLLDKLVELITNSGFEFVETYLHGKLQKFKVSKYKAVYEVNLRTILNMANLTVWEFYGLETLELNIKKKRSDRSTWKCKYNDRILYFSERRLTDRLQFIE